MAKQREESKQEVTATFSLEDYGIAPVDKSTASLAWQAQQELIEFLQSEDAPGKFATVWSDSVKKRDALIAKAKLLATAEALLTEEERKLPFEQRKAAAFAKMKENSAGILSGPILESLGKEWFGVTPFEPTSEANQLLAGAQIQSQRSVYDILNEPLEMRTRKSSAQLQQELTSAIEAEDARKMAENNPYVVAPGIAEGIESIPSISGMRGSVGDTKGRLPSTTPAAEASGINFMNLQNTLENDYIKLGVRDGRMAYQKKGSNKTEDIIYGDEV